METKNLSSVLEELNLTIIESRMEEHLVHGKTLSVFAFQIKAVYKDKEFEWEILKIYEEFRVMLKTLKKATGSELDLPQLPVKSQFVRMTQKAQLEICDSVLSGILGHQNYRKALVFAEFIEVSFSSFEENTQKYKEGYVSALGSSRIKKQKTCWVCYKAVRGFRKLWLRINKFGVEFSQSNFFNEIAEVIPFEKKFQVLTDRKNAIHSDGICVRTSQHNFIFRVGSRFKQKEWKDHITQAFEAFKALDSLQFSLENGVSFPVRTTEELKYYVDSQNYYSDLYYTLKSAQKYVFISDWWMSPELYLLRPSESHPESQIVEVLGSLADKGIEVYVFLYKEITLSLSINSLHTKNQLLERNPNIQVIRHPNFELSGWVFLWSHHSKMVCIDGRVGFMGGLDLCYGRFDNSSHYLKDTEEPYVWNGIDYSNVRVADFVEVENWQQELISRHECPRMPWHDLAVCMKGQVVKDMAKHFREIWNHAVCDITGVGQSMIGLQHQQSIRSFKTRLQSNVKVVLNKVVDHTQVNPEKGLFKNLIDRLKYQNEEQSEVCDLVKVKSNQANIVTEFLSPPRRSRSFKPQTKGALEKNDYQVTKTNLLEQLNTGKTPFLTEKKQGYQSLKVGLTNLLLKKTQNSVECQLTRSAALWSLGKEETENSVLKSYIQEIRNAQYFIYIENQFFMSSTAGKRIKNSVAQELVNKILQKHKNQEPFQVIVAMPILPGFEGEVYDDSAAVLRVQMHWQYKTICRGPSSIYKQLEAEGINPKDYISFYSLRTHSVLGETPVTEMIYIHSKAMIVDDRTVIIGSANINDRSMLGNRDSEIAMVIKDKEMTQSSMAGNPFEVAKSAHQLRISIFKEFSGLSEEVLTDPLSKSFKEAWKGVAKTNTLFYRRVFKCYPDSKIKKFTDISQKTPRLSTYLKKVSQVQGFLVEFPLKFLEEEQLKIKLSDKEYYLPYISFV